MEDCDVIKALGFHTVTCLSYLRMYLYFATNYSKTIQASIAMVTRVIKESLTEVPTAFKVPSDITWALRAPSRATSSRYVKSFFEATRLSCEDSEYVLPQLPSLPL